MATHSTRWVNVLSRITKNCKEKAEKAEGLNTPGPRECTPMTPRSAVQENRFGTYNGVRWIRPHYGGSNTCMASVMPMPAGSPTSDYRNTKTTTLTHCNEPRRSNTRMSAKDPMIDQPGSLYHTHPDNTSTHVSLTASSKFNQQTARRVSSSGSGA